MSCPWSAVQGEKEIRESSVCIFTGGLGPVRGRAAPCAPESVYTAFRLVFANRRLSAEPVTRIEARKLLASIEASRPLHVSATNRHWRLCINGSRPEKSSQPIFL